MWRRVEAARVARLGTVSPAGEPHLVPCTFVLAPSPDGGGGDDHGIVYSAVDEKPKRSRELARLRNVQAHGRAALLVDHYDDDWSELWWVRVRGPARVLREGEERERALDLLAGKYGQYREERPQGPVVTLDAAEWRGWSAS